MPHRGNDDTEIQEMGLDEAPPPTAEEAPMSPKDRVGALKALLNAGKE